MELKGIDRLNQFFTKWLADHDFDAVAELGTDFSVDLSSNTIYYSVVEIADTADRFVNFCKSLEPDLVEVDPFIVSFFHELGHIETEDYWDTKDWERYDKFVEITKDDYTYFNFPIEREATKWGCDYIVNNVEEIVEFVRDYSTMISDFYRINGVELE